MIRYVFRDKPITLRGVNPKDPKVPQLIGEALDKIKKSTKGKCNSKTILDTARDRRNYLHRFFEWDDSVAAEKYRQEQAREIVACIDIVDTSAGKKRQLPAFISLNEKHGRGYHSLGEVLDSAHLQDLALRQAEDDIEALERRLMTYAEICSALRRAREKIAERRARYAASGGHRPHA